MIHARGFHGVYHRAVRTDKGLLVFRNGTRLNADQALKLKFQMYLISRQTGFVNSYSLRLKI
jgi:hypothetical protein